MSIAFNEHPTQQQGLLSGSGRMRHQGFLTHIEKAALPHPPIDFRLLLAIEEGIRTTWKKLVGDAATQKHMLDKKCKEADITISLELALDKLLSTKECPSFTDAHFQTPSRGQEHINFNGGKLEKRPDLKFSFKDRRPGVDMNIYDAVFAECKIVDPPSKNTRLYVKDGLVRFVNGDYAWAVPNAMMIGYVRTSQQLPDPLTDYFKKKTNGEFNSQVYNLLGTPIMCNLSNARKVYRVCRTEHERHWGYPPDEKRKPGNITIRHLWLEIADSKYGKT
jgi:hypothetical protein